MWGASACAAAHQFPERATEDASHFTTPPAQIRPVADRPGGRRLELVSVRTATGPGHGRGPGRNRAAQQTRSSQQLCRSERIDPASRRNSKRRRGSRPHHVTHRELTHRELTHRELTHRELTHGAAFDRHVGSPHGDTDCHTSAPHDDTDRYVDSTDCDARPARPDRRVAGHHVGRTAA